MQNADVKSSYEEGTLRFTLTGEIDHHSAPLVREKMDEAIFLYRPKRAVIALSEIDFMDSSGLGLILGRYRNIKGLEGELLLESPSPRIRKILYLAGVEKLIPIVQKDKEGRGHHEKSKDQ